MGNPGAPLRRERWIVAWALALVSICAMGLVGCGPQTVVDASSPQMVDASIEAGSDLTEASQYVEVRLRFDAPLEAKGDVRDDLVITVDGDDPDTRTMQVAAQVEGSDVIVRLTPTQEADGRSKSVYFALYEGVVEVAPRAHDGALVRVHASGGQSNAVAQAVSFTVPTGIEVANVNTGAGDLATGRAASVEFDVTQFAQLRCCTWFDFGTGPFYMHNHEFWRDLPSTTANRLAQTVNAHFADSLVAHADGAHVRIEAIDVVDGQQLGVEILEGRGVNPVAAGAAAPDMAETGKAS